MKVGVKRFPINNECSADGLVLFSPAHQQIKARVVDVVQVLEINVQLDVMWHTLQLCGKQW